MNKQAAYVKIIYCMVFQTYILLLQFLYKYEINKIVKSV